MAAGLSVITKDDANGNAVEDDLFKEEDLVLAQEDAKTPLKVFFNPKHHYGLVL